MLAAPTHCRPTVPTLSIVPSSATSLLLAVPSYMVKPIIKSALHPFPLISLPAPPQLPLTPQLPPPRGLCLLLSASWWTATSPKTITLLSPSVPQNPSQVPPAPPSSFSYSLMHCRIWLINISGQFVAPSSPTLSWWIQSFWAIVRTSWRAGLAVLIVSAHAFSGTYLAWK